MSHLIESPDESVDDMLWKDAPAGLKRFRQEKRKEKREKRKDQNVQLK